MPGIERKRLRSIPVTHFWPRRDFLSQEIEILGQNLTCLVESRYQLWIASGVVLVRSNQEIAESVKDLAVVLWRDLMQKDWIGFVWHGPSESQVWIDVSLHFLGLIVVLLFRSRGALRLW